MQHRGAITLQCGFPAIATQLAGFAVPPVLALTLTRTLKLVLHLLEVVAIGDLSHLASYLLLINFNNEFLACCSACC